MTRLGYLVPEWPAQTHAFFHRELSALRDLGNEVFLFSTRKPKASACRHAFGPAARRETYYLFPPNVAAATSLVRARPKPSWEALRYAASLREEDTRGKLTAFGLLPCAADLAARCRELGVKHLHVHSCAAAAHLAAMAQLMGGPSFSLTLHGDLPIYGFDHRKKMAHAAFVSVVTRPLQKQVMEEARVPKEKAPVITMGVDTQHFQPGPGRSAEPGKLHLATVARLNPMKGHKYVFEAMAAARDRGVEVRYSVAGDGELRGELQDAARKLGLESAVTFLGSLGEPEVLALLQQADAFVLASEGQGEAAPVSVMEAMACGLPVIVSRIGGTPDMIDDGKDGLLVPQTDVKALTEAIESLAKAPGLRSRLGEAARARATAEFDYHKKAQLLDREFRNVTAG